jgi:hypothetical protein
VNEKGCRRHGRRVLLAALHHSTPAARTVGAYATRAASLLHEEVDDGGPGGTSHQRRVEVLAELDINQVALPARWAYTAVVLNAHLTTAVGRRVWGSVISKFGVLAVGVVLARPATWGFLACGLMVVLDVCLGGCG